MKTIELIYDCCSNPSIKNLKQYIQQHTQTELLSAHFAHLKQQSGSSAGGGGSRGCILALQTKI